MDSNKLLTRSEAAKILKVSISTVRRLEQRNAVPVQQHNGVHYFRLADLQQLASARQPTPKKLTSGELAAEVFRRFEQAQGISEIVQALAVDPRKVRALYHEWRTPLELTELSREDANPPRDPSTQRRRRSILNPEALLATLSTDKPTRLSLARFSTEWFTNHGDDGLIYHELGGIVVYGPTTLEALLTQWGPGDFRLTAYDLSTETRLWETYIKLDATPPAQPSSS